MKVVVTGGAGFIGANLCRALVARPEIDQVVALDDLSTGPGGTWPASPASSSSRASILDAALLDRVVGRTDAVVHLAARPSVPRSLDDPMASHLTNATGTMEVLEAARRHGGPHVVVASSSSVYGANPALPEAGGHGHHAGQPLRGQQAGRRGDALAYGRSFGLPVLAFRFFNVFGPLQAADHAYAAVVPAFVSARPARRSPPRPRRRAPDPRLHLRGHRDRGAGRRRRPRG